MSNPVICSRNSDLEIGQIYQGLVLGPWSWPEPSQKYRVISRSDEQAWIDYLVEFHGEIGEGMRDHYETCAQNNGPWYYYEIETD